jgi:dihydropteroate synthase
MRTVEAAGLSIGPDAPPRIMGVLNVSRESPYDPSVFADADAAAAHAADLIDEGADIVDVGLASANKRFEPLTAAEERDRLDTAVAAMERTDGEAVFSIETRYAEVAAAALDRGFDMVNDVCGFADPEMPAVCADRDVAVVKMASPPDLTRPGAVREHDWNSSETVADGGSARAAAGATGSDDGAAPGRAPGRAEPDPILPQLHAALDRGGFTAKTIVDPAFGGWSEATTLADDRETFRYLSTFRAFGRPILVSINRKNFLGEIVGRETDERLPASLAATALAVERGANVIRTHDVSATRDASLIGDALGDRPGSRA